MKICHLTSVHPSSDTRVFHRQCRSLATAGVETVLIVAEEDSEIRDRVRIEGVGKPRSRLHRLTQIQFRILNRAISEHADLYQFHDPELIPVGLLLKLVGCRVVYDIHEDIPRTILDKHWLPTTIRPLVSRMVERMEKIACRAFDGLITVTEQLAERFPAQRPTLVRNYPLQDELTGTESRKVRRIPKEATTGPAQFAYVGAISGPRGNTEILRAIEQLNHAVPARLLMAGRIADPDYETLLRGEKGWQHVDYHGFRTRPEIADLLGQSLAGLVTLHPTPNHLGSLPTKLFEYMSASLPVIASHDQPWSRIVSETGCGLLVDPGDSADIANAMRWMIEHGEEADSMGVRGRQAIEAAYNWESQFLELLQVCERISGQTVVRSGMLPALEKEPSREPRTRAA